MGSQALGAVLQCLDAAWQHARRWDDYLQALEDIGKAIADSGYLGLSDVCLLVEERLSVLGREGEVPDEAFVELLDTFPHLAHEYLAAADRRDSAELLVTYLRDPRWPAQLEREEEDVLLDLLVSESDPVQAEQAEDIGEDALTAAPFGGGAVESPDMAAPGSGAAESPEMTALGSGAAESPEMTALGSGAAESLEMTAPDTAVGGSRAVEYSDDTAQAELSSGLRELIELLSTELALMRERVAELTPSLQETATPSAVRSDALDSLGDEVVRFAEAAEAVGFSGLGRLAQHFAQNLRLWSERQTCMVEAELDALASWCAHASGYLKAFSRRDRCEALVSFAGSSIWPQPLSDTDASALLETLVAPDLGDADEQTEQRQTVASADDVSLALPQDVDPALLDGLLQELPTQTGEFSESVQRLNAGDGSLADVEAAQRVAHTLKGAANTVGVRGVATLTHHLEDILLASTKQTVLPGRSLSNALMLAADCLESMSEALLGISPPPPDAVEVLQQVLDWANRIDAEGMDTAAVATTSTSIPSTEAQSEPPDDHDVDDVETKTAVPAAEDVGTKTSVPAVPMVRVPAPVLDELLRLVGETVTLTGQVQERLDQTRAQTQTMHHQLLMLEELGEELERLIDLRDMSTSHRQLGTVDEFDPLELDQYNELHTCTRRLVEAATDAGELGKGLVSRLSGLDEMLVNQGRLNRESQEAVLQTRMVSVQTVLPRLQRSVRQTCRVTGKSAELQVSGSDTMVDSDVLSDLIDPLMHLLRNAVDHGVETREERVASAKPAMGRIDLSFHREGNTLVVRCRDDGRGLDLAVLRQRAVEQGVINADDLVTDTELKRLILEPSFSTRADVTQVSGRGIGMSAVYSQVTRLGGTLNIESETGEGCVIEMRLPVTLIATHALLVRAQRSIFAVSNRGLEQILHAGAGEIEQIADELVLHLGEHDYTAYHLERLVGLSGERRRHARRDKPILLIRGDAATCAVLVEEVVDSRDVVIKRLGKYVPALRGVAGATILGDGSVAPVLDLPELLRTPSKMVEHAEAVERLALRAQIDLPTALVVDDSLSARRSLAQFMEDSGFEVRTARDGLEAIEVLQAKRPDVLLVDLEMPRMNGLELTSHVRSRADMKNVPIIMITSRSTHKHRKQAESAGVDAYMTKPFAEEQLLNHISRIHAGATSSAAAG